MNNIDENVKKNELKLPKIVHVLEKAFKDVSLMSSDSLR